MTKRPELLGGDRRGRGGDGVLWAMRYADVCLRTREVTGKMRQRSAKTLRSADLCIAPCLLRSKAAPVLECEFACLELKLHGVVSRRLL